MEKEKKNYMKKGVVLAVVLLLMGASFYGGTLYSKSNSPRSFAGATGGQFGQGPRGTGAVARGMSGFTAGEIIAKDATSITIKMQDGSTKIVLLGESTKVMKSTDGSLNELIVGTTVTVNGTTNSDKSVTATSIQIRPLSQSTPPPTPQ